ncbi:MAG TPA: GAF domain-containing protein [Streptosporangiaceae bacterium]
MAAQLNDRIAGEQAALRRVVTLVAQTAEPEEVFAAVAAEVGRLLGVHHAMMTRYDPDGARTLVATWDSTGTALPVGTRTSLGGQNVTTLVFQTGRPARIDDSLRSPPGEGTILQVQLPVGQAPPAPSV